MCVKQREIVKLNTQESYKHPHFSTKSKVSSRSLILEAVSSRKKEIMSLIYRREYFRKLKVILVVSYYSLVEISF